jgi:predicted DNA-binding protein with PD1-like motif
VSKVVSGEIGRVVYARLDAGADLLQSLLEVIKSENIGTGFILDITGALNVARLQHFSEVGDPESKVGVIEIQGPMEASGGGVIGRCVGTGGVGGYVDGEPYLHCHLSVTSAEQTFVGHLMPGTIVRAPHYGRGNTKSHFTVVIGEVRGVDLQMVSGGPGDENNGLGTWTPQDGYVYHELDAV